MAYPTSKSQSHPTIYNTIPLFCHQSHFSVINPTICLSIPLFVQSHYYYSCHHPAWCSLTLGCASGAGHSLPGAHPLDPLVHIFNPSFGTHVSSSSGTHVLSYGTALTNAQLCFGAGGMPPALVHIFHLMAQHLLTLSCALDSLYHQYQFIYTYLQVLMYMYRNCSKFYNKMTTFKISQDELQDIQYFSLQDLDVDCPKLS